jgi:hypothetical protein
MRSRQALVGLPLAESIRLIWFSEWPHEIPPGKCEEQFKCADYETSEWTAGPGDLHRYLVLLLFLQ